MIILCRILKLEMRLKETLSRCKGQAYDTHGPSKVEKPKQAGGRTPRSDDSGRNSRGSSDTHINAWAFSEASIGNVVYRESSFVWSSLLHLKCLGADDFHWQIDAAC